MSTSPSKKFGLKRATELRNIAEFTKEEMENIQLTKCESNNFDKNISNNKTNNSSENEASTDAYFDNNKNINNHENK